MASSVEDELGDLPPVEASPSNTWQHPPSFYCPISHQCMHDPVVLSDGHSYERRHIERWLQDHSTSPVSGLLLYQTDLFPNHALRNAIEEYFQQIFSAHRRAIRKTMCGPSASEDAAASVSLVHAIDALMQCSLLMSEDLSIECVLRQIMEQAKTLLGAEAASVFLLDAERQELYSTVNSLGREIRIPIAVGIAGCVARSGEPLVIHEAYNDGRFDRTVDVRSGFRTRNIMCVPLKDRRGGVIGVVQLINKTSAGKLGSQHRRPSKVFEANGLLTATETLRSDSFTADDQHFLMVFASQAASAIANSGAFTMPQSQAAMPQSSAVGSTEDAPLAAPDTVDGRAESLEGTLMKAGLTEDGPLAASGTLDGRVDILEGAPMKPAYVAGKQNIAADQLLESAFHSQHFDAFALAEVTDNKPLSVLGVYLFSRLGFVDLFGLNPDKLRRFLEEVQRGYDDSNPYHNRAHAASVLHAMHMLLEHGGVMSAAAPVLAGEESCGSKCDHKGSSAQLERMACLLAAAINDYQHKGLSNDFLVKTSHERAVRYNDQHVNEHHHLAASFDVLLRPEYNFLECLHDHDFRRLRSLMIDLVLSTDLAQHGKILQSAQEVLSTCSGRPGSHAASRPVSGTEAVPLLQLAMKCADLAHSASEWALHSRWVRCAEEEFFLQGDKERAAGLPVSLLMDRCKPGASSAQAGFFEAIVLPLFRLLARMAPGTTPMLAAAEANCRRWGDLEASVAASPMEAAQQLPRRRVSRIPSLSATQQGAAASGGGGPGVAAEDPRKRRSGRARQRAAKFWASVRRPTPSPSPSPPCGV